MCQVSDREIKWRPERDGGREREFYNKRKEPAW